NIQHARGTSSTLKIYGQKPAIGYDEYDSDNADVISSEVGAQRPSSTGRGGITSFALGAEKLPPSSVARLARSSSPLRIGHTRSPSPLIEEFVVDNSPRRVVERVSPSHSGFDHGLGRVTGKDKEMSNLRRNHWSDTHRPFDMSGAYNYSNGIELQGPRALIDAYGNDQGKRTPNNSLKVERLDINGIDSKVATKHGKIRRRKSLIGKI
ncbi:hypothetical protein F0562_014268, partial [Nyssa sinensis]